MTLPPFIDVLLLYALRSGPDYGHRLTARFESLHGDFRPSPSTIYPALRRLQRTGLATATTVAQRSDRGGKPRTVYRLTPKGLRRAEKVVRFLAELERSTAPRPPSSDADSPEEAAA